MSTIYEPAYWAFIKGVSEASPDPEFNPHCGDAQCQEKAEQLLVLVPERLTAREKGFLFGIFKWRGPGAMPLEHRRKVDRLYQALNDLDETS
jgi:hypothetical protein